MPYVLNLISLGSEDMVNLIRPVKLLNFLASKNRFSAAMPLVYSSQALFLQRGNPAELAEFIKTSVQVLIKLRKVTEAFSFLEQTESLAIDNETYKHAVASLIEYLVTLPRQEIENLFLSANFTRR